MEVEFLEITYCNIRVSKVTTTHKHAKYDVLISHCHQRAKQILPSLMVTTCIKGTIITHSIKKLIDLEIPLIKFLKRILRTSYQTKEKRKKKKNSEAHVPLDSLDWVLQMNTPLHVGPPPDS